MTAVVIGVVVIISYTSVGGFSAVATMDLIQSIIMTIALAIIVVFGIVQAGGMDAVLDHARTLPGFLSFGETYNAAVALPSRKGMRPAAETARPTMPMNTATPMEITTQTEAIRRDSFSSFSSRMAIKRTRIWGMPK